MKQLGMLIFVLFASSFAQAQTVSLDAPEQATIGANVEVSWTGPGENYHTVYVVKAGAPDKARGINSTTILRGKNPVVVVMADEPGAYELRYWDRKEIIARRPISVVDVPTSLDAPASAKMGSTLEVSWEGPGNDYDWIGLYEASAADAAKSVAGTSILSQKNPVSFRLPEQAGRYDLRYVTAQSKQVLARRPLQIGSVEASLDAPQRATAATLIEVHWQGPGNDYDQIAVFETDAKDDAKSLAQQTILSGKNPVNLWLPEGEGTYELRYRTAQSGQVLARRPITIEPAGRLAVVFERDGEVVHSQGTGAVELILDASGSMLQRENGTRRIEIARTVLDELVREHLSEERGFALRVFGHKEADKCRTDLEIPLGPLDRQAAAARIASINAKNLAKTPIADSLAKVSADLAGADGPKTVILITDGEETCEGDPATVIQDLRSKGLAVQVSIVGFAIDGRVGVF